MKKNVIIFILLSFYNAFSQELINIFPKRISHKISPYIYGSNQTLLTNVTTAMRLGGNRITGYNWVNNYSNAGSDWFHSNDNYMPWVMGIPEKDYKKTGIVLTEFHQNNINNNCYSLITLPMAGFVAKDSKGTVEENQIAPSDRWAKVVNQKGKNFEFYPNIDSDTVYIDECINFLNNKFKDSKQINAYSLDNEPGLWAYTHPRLHKEKISVSEIIEKSASLAATIKKMAPQSEIFGPALYGFNAYLNLQEAPDWNNYKSKYNRFIDAYLDLMKNESQKVGTRLIDVLDVHWYPEPEGVYSGDTTREASIRRMESIRSLWDSTYIEDSWIGKWFSPVAMLKYLKQSINKYYTDTKIGLTEYNYGANNHISGGIAQAQLLGVLGKENIYFASKWEEISGFNKLAFEIYGNYDGKYSKFGNLSIDNDAKNNNGLSVFSSIDEKDSTIHLIVINSDYDKIREVNFAINSDNNYVKYDEYAVFQNSIKVENVSLNEKLTNNELITQISPLSIFHFVIKTDGINSIQDIDNQIVLSPNPASDYIEIGKPSEGFEPSEGSVIKIYNSFGELVITDVQLLRDVGHLKRIDISHLPAGLYFIQIGNYSEKFMVLR